MKEAYKNDIDKIHAPEDLIDRTKKAVRLKEAESGDKKQESVKPKNHFVTWKKFAIAACVCLVIFSGSVVTYKRNNYIVVNPSVVEATHTLDTKISFGKIDMDSNQDEIKIQKFRKKTELIRKIWGTSPSKIHGIEVYIVRGEEKNSYYSAYKKGNKFYLAYGKNMKQKEFIKKFTEILLDK